ncbi:MAG: hypothetical protein QXO86_01430 [Nitrososphaerota archaeon]
MSQALLSWAASYLPNLLPWLQQQAAQVPQIAAQNPQAAQVALQALSQFANSTNNMMRTAGSMAALASNMGVQQRQRERIEKDEALMEQAGKSAQEGILPGLYSPVYDMEKLATLLATSHVGLGGKYSGPHPGAIAMAYHQFNQIYGPQLRAYSEAVEEAKRFNAAQAERAQKQIEDMKKIAQERPEEYMFAATPGTEGRMGILLSRVTPGMSLLGPFTITKQPPPPPDIKPIDWLSLRTHVEPPQREAMIPGIGGGGGGGGGGGRRRSEFYLTMLSKGDNPGSSFATRTVTSTDYRHVGTYGIVDTVLNYGYRKPEDERRHTMNSINTLIQTTSNNIRYFDSKTNTAILNAFRDPQNIQRHLPQGYTAVSAENYGWKDWKGLTAIRDGQNKDVAVIYYNSKTGQYGVTVRNPKTGKMILYSDAVAAVDRGELGVKDLASMLTIGGIPLPSVFANTVKDVGEVQALGRRLHPESSYAVTNALGDNMGEAIMLSLAMSNPASYEGVRKSGGGNQGGNKTNSSRARPINSP